jgi:hypothetical protein
MIVNIVIPIIVLAIIILAFAMCKSASEYDDISEEYWKEYERKENEKSV